MPTSLNGPATVSVVFNRPLEPYTYSVPDGLRGDVPVGALVEVPIRRQRDIGCVVAHDPPAKKHSHFKLRPLLRRVSPGYRIDAELLSLARWISSYYFCTLGEALSMMSMIGFADIQLREKAVYRLAENWADAVLTKRQRQAAAVLSEKPLAGPVPAAELARRAGCSAAIVKKLREAGALIEEETALPPPVGVPPPDIQPELLPEQREAHEAVSRCIDKDAFGVFLLYGVTGSGKTEVYLRLIEKVFAGGRSVLCLVPEISLTPQTVERFSRRFQEEIGVFHSQLTRREKLILYEKIKRGMIRLVIGARSATFSPLPNLGLVIIDEEHESSYKQSDTPRYHARDTAIMRANRLGIPVLMGSATPSMESYENATRGKYTMLQLSVRPAGLQMPNVRIVSLAKSAIENPAGYSMLSEEMKHAMDERIARGEQVLLFLNRRGFSNFLMCPSCRWVARCIDDDIVLTIHRRGARKQTLPEEMELDLFPRPLKADQAFLKCHFCGTKHDYPTVCPECGEDGLVAMGSGTQRVEESLKRLFPTARILRLDQDSVGGRQGFLKAWREMVSGEAQIILGTQMIAKGLHLERVSLVGVVLAEVGLFIPDFRAEERTFSLLTQVAGRSGRTNMGDVILQTYMPHQPAVQLAALHDYKGFFKAEMYRRRKMGFPPCGRLIALTLSGEDLNRTMSTTRVLAGVLRRLANREEWREVKVLGPQAAPIERLAGRFRQRILLRGPNQKTSAAMLRAALADPQWRPPTVIKLSIDVDPQDLL